MELLPEIYHSLIGYLSLDDLHEFRITNKDNCKITKTYEGDSTEFVTPRWLTLCFRCFPNLKHLSTTYCNVSRREYGLFAQLEELTIHTRSMFHEDIFATCIHLKHLYITSEIFNNNLDYLDYGYGNVDRSFKHLTHLKQLTLTHAEQVTDTGLRLAQGLEKLHLHGLSKITVSSLGTLKNLRILYIDTYERPRHSLIRDEAFEGLLLEELYITCADYITDRGILHLKQLRKLIFVNVPGIQGEGFNQLKRLETVGCGQNMIHSVAHFKHVKTLTFDKCTIVGKFCGLWKNLAKLRLLGNHLVYPETVQTMMCPRLKKIIIQCPQLKKSEALRKTFGKRLIYKS